MSFVVDWFSDKRMSPSLKNYIKTHHEIRMPSGRLPQDTCIMYILVWAFVCKHMYVYIKTYICFMYIVTFTHKTRLTCISNRGIVWHTRLCVIHTYICTRINSNMQARMRKEPRNLWTHICVHITYVHIVLAYIHTYIHTYTYIHTIMHTITRGPEAGNRLCHLRATKAREARRSPSCRFAVCMYVSYVCVCESICACMYAYACAWAGSGVESVMPLCSICMYVCICEFLQINTTTCLHEWLKPFFTWMIWRWNPLLH